MKAIAIGSVLAALAFGAAHAQPAPPAKPKAADDHPTVCLWTYMIDHTTTPDARTIIFHMRGGKAWKNTLLAPCPGLKFDGFAYVTRDGQICSNMQSIMILRTHAVCLLGAFEPYVPPPKKAPANP